ncbi:MAG: hypothetical protein EBR88_04905, partial [Betaproteobacteria bacterium]|nr:hypothetical protein [Betaproteobacteria bacterium]
MTTAQQTDAYRFFVIAFGAAPGVTYMNQLADAYDSGMTTKAVVNAFVSKDVFKAQYPSFLTNEQFAQTLVTNVVGDAATAAAKTEAQTQIVAALASGMSRGDVIFNVFNNIASKPATDAMWGTLSTKLANQVAYAKYYTETLRGDTTTVATLQNVVKNVTATSDVTAAGIAAVLNPPVAPVSQTFTLTTGVDNFTGGAGNDVFNAAPGASNANTFTALDLLDGGTGTDTLNLN